MLNFKSVLEAAQGIIEHQKKALAAKGIVDAQNEKLKADNEKLQAQAKELHDKVLGIELQHAEERQKINASISPAWKKPRSFSAGIQTPV